MSRHSRVSNNTKSTVSRVRKLRKEVLEAAMPEPEGEKPAVDVVTVDDDATLVSSRDQDEISQVDGDAVSVVPS
jgi:hypothetical protein